MSRNGNCWDNAVAESFFFAFEVELSASWRDAQDVERAAAEYIDGFYKPRRRYSHNQYLSPIDFEQRFVQQENASQLPVSTKPVKPNSDLARLRKYALPDIGAPTARRAEAAAHARPGAQAQDWQSRARTILSMFWTLHAMYEEALVDELVTANPVIVKPGVLPKKRDKDPTWRSLATYTTTEVMQLITDPRIPAERRVRYAFKAIAGMRHGEVAALAIQQIDFTPRRCRGSTWSPRSAR